jgi:uncharacterized membrane protein YqjE
MALRQSVGDLASTLLSILRTRLELFSLEAAEQKGRVVVLMGLAAAAILFFVLAVFVFTAAVAVYFWPTEDRYLALCVLALCYLVLAAGFSWAIRSQLVHGGLPFAATIDELRRDMTLAERLREPADDTARDHRGPLGGKEFP